MKKIINLFKEFEEDYWVIYILSSIAMIVAVSYMLDWML